MAVREAEGYTVRQIWESGPDRLPEIYDPSAHLIFNSPASLAFNSPGAEGFGVKRAGLAVPGSVMLIVSPGCCGRNTSEIVRIEGYEDRFFYLEISETDLVTGRHLKKIPQAVEEVAEACPQRPSVVMICVTCVDALLGTDMDRVSRKAEERTHIPVRPCYMYALTREGRRPPMVQVRQSLYSLLPEQKRKPGSVNILGFFSPLDEESELLAVLRESGIRKIRQISTCPDMEEFRRMGEANFNLVLNPEAREAAADLKKRLGIGSIELTRFYGSDRIDRQYQALSEVLSGLRKKSLSSEKQILLQARKEASDAFGQLKRKYPEIVFSVGERLNANPFELALTLAEEHFRVREIFGNPSPADASYIKKLARLSPDTMVYSNMEPTMLYYRSGDTKEIPDAVALGKDAAWYHPDAVSVLWNSDVQPWGYAGVRKLAESICAACDHKDRREPAAVRVTDARGPEEGCAGRHPAAHLKSLRKSLTPFAPDQSGAAGVLYGLGGIAVIVDAGGCAGNICGFDEPRWTAHPSAVFSAGLRDMDAVMGRDEVLVKKTADCVSRLGADFAALIGTPVPAVIGTDFSALEKMLEKRVSIPVLSIPTDGMHLYDRGVELTYRQLLRKLCSSGAGCEAGGIRHPEAGYKADGSVPGGRDHVRGGIPYGIGRGDGAGEFFGRRVGLFGVTPLDLPGKGSADFLKMALEKEGYSEEEVILYGCGASLEDYRQAGKNEKNIAVSPDGISSVKYLAERFGTPYEIRYPGAEEEGRRIGLDSRAAAQNRNQDRMRILLLHHQVLCSGLRKGILREIPSARILSASWFDMAPEILEPGDVRLREEDDFERLMRDFRPDILIGDPVLLRLAPDFEGRFISIPQFAVSGKRYVM